METTSPLICDRCNNVGYYEIGINNSPDKLQMFCACESGRKIRKLSVNWRLTDMRVIADSVVPLIKDAKSKLAKPSEAGKVLDEILKDFQSLIKRVEDGLHDN